MASSHHHLTIGDQFANTLPGTKLGDAVEAEGIVLAQVLPLPIAPAAEKPRNPTEKKVSRKIKRAESAAAASKPIPLPPGVLAREVLYDKGIVSFFFNPQMTRPVQDDFYGPHLLTVVPVGRQFTTIRVTGKGVKMIDLTKPALLACKPLVVRDTYDGRSVTKLELELTGGTPDREFVIRMNGGCHANRDFYATVTANGGGIEIFFPAEQAN